MAGVEEEDREDLVIVRSEMEAQVVASVARVRDRGAAADAVREDRAGGVEDLVRGGGTGGACGVVVKRLFDMVGAPWAFRGGIARGPGAHGAAQPSEARPVANWRVTADSASSRRVDGGRRGKPPT